MQDKPMGSDECLVVMGKLFKMERYAEKIRKTKESNCKQAIFHHNDYEDIIPQIIHINFPSLTLLHLSYNKIKYIEPLKYLDAPLLQTLHLSFNEFHQARALRKCRFPKLTKLSLMGTNTVDFDSFYQFHFPQLQNFMLEDAKNPNDNRCSNLSVFSKFQAKINGGFTIVKDRKSKSVLEMLKSRK